MCCSDGQSRRCWGNNAFGQLGQLATDGRFPVDVGLSNVAQVAVGDTFTCALSSDGTVTCFGADGHGEQGDDGGGANDPKGKPHVVQLPPASNIASGLAGTCANTDAGVMCWGPNISGELGCPSGSDHTTPPTNYLTPQPLTPSTGGTGMSIGSGMACFSDPGTNQTVCYGNRQAGLGDGVQNGQVCWSSNFMPGSNEVLYDDTPTPVGALDGLSTGAGFSCGILTTALNRPFCWGLDDNGQVDGVVSGNPILFATNPPAAHQGLLPAKIISTGATHTCALYVDLDGGADVECWGNGNNGRLGQGSGPSAEIVHKLTDVIDLAAHFAFTCALQRDGDVRCWGLGRLTSGITTWYFLGNGDGADVLDPASVKF